jgi:hypothetical protein
MRTLTRRALDFNPSGKRGNLLATVRVIARDPSNSMLTICF